MMNFIWFLLAKLLALPLVSGWIIRRAMKTPYYPIVKDGDVYMERFWLLNPYESVDGQQMGSRHKWFPLNVRVHWIRLPDQDRHLHDHPWNARTIILRGGYIEQRLGKPETRSLREPPTVEQSRLVGDTAQLRFGEYHRIKSVFPEGAWTLFISGPYQGTWGFLVDGLKVRWRVYLGLEEERP